VSRRDGKTPAKNEGISLIRQSQEKQRTLSIQSESLTSCFLMESRSITRGITHVTRTVESTPEITPLTSFSDRLFMSRSSTSCSGSLVRSAIAEKATVRQSAGISRSSSSSAKIRIFSAGPDAISALSLTCTRGALACLIHMAHRTRRRRVEGPTAKALRVADEGRLLVDGDLAVL